MKNQEKLFYEKKIKKKDIVLDVGCWSGGKVNSLLNKCQPYGIDIDKNKLDLAPKRIKKRLFLGDITKKETINKIKRNLIGFFLEEVLEHIEKDELALKNINFLLKRNGKLVLTTPKSIFLLEFWDPAWIRWKFLGGQRHYHYTKKELYEKLKKARFTIEEIKLTGNIKWLFFRWANTILKNILRSKAILRLKESSPNKKKNGFFDWRILAKKNEK